MKRIKYFLFTFCVLAFVACSLSTQKEDNKENKIIKIWLIGDSTVADYANNYDKDGNYMKDRFPVTGWGQVFQEFVSGEKLQELKPLLQADSVIVEDRARGGRSTRTFFQEGRWRSVYESLQPGDFVLMQFGHNDAAKSKPERYVNEEGYMEFLRLFIQQTREKKAVPIILTPVARNYPWEDGKLKNVHGNYPDCAKQVATETNTMLIDLNEMSMEYFTEKGQEYVSSFYFMNLPAGKYEAYPDGQNDNTHFQPEGAKEVAGLVYKGLKEFADNNKTTK